MSLLATALRDRPILKGALLVPSLIALIFSLFNLSAVPEPARLAAATVLATVNDDQGLTFPPINVATLMLNGLSQRLPLTLRPYATEAEARAALDAEDVAAILLFPNEFSLSVTGSEVVPLRLVTSGALPAAQAQLVSALPGMLETGVAVAVQSIRAAMAAGRMPDMASPVALNAEVIHPAANAASRAAPFIANFVTALAALVGAILGWVGSRGLEPIRAALLRGLLPVLALPPAALVLVAVIGSFAGGDLLGLWLTVIGLGVAFGWFFAGALAVLGPFALLILVPLVFWQGILGGAQVPASVAPDWLHGLAPLGLEAIGGTFRALVLGGQQGFPVALACGAALCGLALIWLRALVSRE